MKGNHPTLTILSIIIMTFSKLLAVLILVGLLPKMEFVGNKTKMKTGSLEADYDVCENQKRLHGFSSNLTLRLIHITRTTVTIAPRSYGQRNWTCTSYLGQHAALIRISLCPVFVKHFKISRLLIARFTVHVRIGLWSTIVETNDIHVGYIRLYTSNADCDT